MHVQVWPNNHEGVHGTNLVRVAPLVTNSILDF